MEKKVQVSGTDSNKKETTIPPELNKVCCGKCQLKRDTLLKTCNSNVEIRTIAEDSQIK